MITCNICQANTSNMTQHMIEVHDVDWDTPQPLLEHNQRRTATSQGMKVSFGKIQVNLHTDVELSACLPLPYAYRLPESGELASDILDATIALANRRHCYFWGDAGAGKDAIIHAWSYMTQTPALVFQIQPGVDIQSWFFTHEFSKDGTYWKEGELLAALRDGYVSPLSGRRIPYMILLTDMDRASSDQLEALRLVLDSISGRVKGPNGKTYQVLPHTQIVATGNTAGSGDSRGKYTSSKVIDSSMMDRFERVVQFHGMKWMDEEMIVKDKFPFLLEEADWVFGQVGKATEALREAIQKEEIYGEFSHRGVCAWLGMIEDTLRCDVRFADPIRNAFRVVADKMPDVEAREQAYNVINPYLSL